MRVLVSSTPGAGHVLPLVPVARALRDAGHEVRWATGPDAQQRVRDAGLDPVVAGLDQPTRMRRFAEGWPEVRSLPPRERRAVMFPALFATLSAGPMLEDLTAAGEQFRPDLLVHEPCEIAAGLLARGTGTPHAVVGFGRMVPPDLLAAAAAQVARLGLAGPDEVPDDLGLLDDAYLHPLPASLEPVAADRPSHPVRPEGYAGPARPGRTGRADHRRPAVYVTFGTEFGAQAPWGAVIEALAELDVDALLTIGSGIDPPELGPTPARVRIERWVPQRQALAGSDLVVSHGGAGAMIGAASAGLPHLVLPLGADHFENADLVAAAGIGRLVEPAEVDPARLLTEMRSLLEDDGARAAATRAATDFAAMPAAESVVGALESLVDRYR